MKEIGKIIRGMELDLSIIRKARRSKHNGIMEYKSINDCISIIV